MPIKKLSIVAVALLASFSKLEVVNDRGELDIHLRLSVETFVERLQALSPTNLIEGN